MSTPPKSKRCTIKDVAAEAEVSISTVSLAMSGKGYVRADTRARVLKAAQHLGYVPTLAARQLAAQETGNVGFVLRADHFTRSEPFYTHIFLGAEYEADQHGLYVLLTTIPEVYVPGEHTPRFLRERNVDGVLVAGKVDPAVVAEVETADLPFVLIDLEMDHHPAALIDNQSGARAAVEHLLDRGHRRIAFIGADMEHPSLRSRLDGYRLALNAAGLTPDPTLIITAPQGNPDRETGMLLGEQLWACKPRPTAVFCVNDALALGVLDLASRQDIAVPDTLAVVGFDDVDGAKNATPALSTVRVFKEQLGELALRYLTELIAGHTRRGTPYKRGHHAIKVPTEMVVRASSNVMRNTA